tara:strand:- start:874 stop:1326 length:453 start_codon:yes stop_codon:yes gene_type:complete
LFLKTPIANYIPYDNVLRAFWSSFPIDCVAIGGLYGILLFQKSKYLKYLLRNDLFYFSILFVVLLMIKGVHIPCLHYNSILDFSANDKNKISLENKIFNYLGNISYGLYIYHPIGIVLAIFISKSIDIYTNWLLYPLSLLLTVIIAGGVL